MVFAISWWASSVIPVAQKQQCMPTMEKGSLLLLCGIFMPLHRYRRYEIGKAAEKLPLFRKCRLDQSGQKMGMKIIDTIRITMLRPRPGRKKSMNFRLPGRTIRVFVPLPTGERKGVDAATQIATATGMVFMPKA